MLCVMIWLAYTNHRCLACVCSPVLDSARTKGREDERCFSQVNYGRQEENLEEEKNMEKKILQDGRRKKPKPKKKP